MLLNLICHSESFVNVILKEALRLFCHSERSEESYTAQGKLRDRRISTQDKLREESNYQ